MTEHRNKGSNFTVILVQPQNPENIGLVARNMKNTGFGNLRIVKVGCLKQESYKTAVHSGDILERTRFY